MVMSPASATIIRDDMAGGGYAGFDPAAAGGDSKVRRLVHMARREWAIESTASAVVPGALALGFELHFLMG